MCVWQGVGGGVPGWGWPASRAFLGRDLGATLSLATLGAWALAGMQRWWAWLECH